MRIIVPFLICLRLIYSAELPHDIKKCKFGDGKCIKESINQLIKKYPKGIPSMGITAFDEFRPMDNQLLDFPRIGGMWLRFRLTDQVISGCENATLTHVSGFEEDPTQKKIEIRLRIPRLTLRSQYEMQERWLSMVQSNTTGGCYAELQNFNLTVNFRVIFTFRNQKRYLKIYQLVPSIDVGRFHMQLDNLYKDNLDLTLAVNRVHNEYWDEVWNDIKPKFIPKVSRSMTWRLNKIFESISYDDMFLS